ncbi:hypothetical protein K2173_013805 [Erythroxylum novogranatense]|uniref:Lysosomal Pro-X carboxypeptidase n=1 Tax=Erythroxylum novogranatense TaxID=1862640 RepID=A0AAV8SCI0_9ROSI|nr:hypothetical protein K2173_013805 [Erythroxylum novogranatense]
MKCSSVLFQWLQLLSLLILLTNGGHATRKINWRLPIGLTHFKDNDVVTESVLSDDAVTIFYNQTLDHFNYRPESYETFQQRYVISTKYWGGANARAPIFVHFGAESSLDNDLEVVGFFPENAQRFNACLLYIEHRFYGQSVPFHSSDDALKNASLRGYFSSSQAIADYAEIIIHVKQNLRAEDSPVIVSGGSYGGMLASWFRLKYPHIAIGALASSAPILYFDNITPQNGYYSVVTKDFKEISETCYQAIQKSWAEIDQVAAQPNGMSILSQKFMTCNPLDNSAQLTDLLGNIYCSAAQYNRAPSYRMNKICAAIDSSVGNDTLSRVFAGMVAYLGSSPCYSTRNFVDIDGWDWQTCSEMVMPIARGTGTMFPPDSFDYNKFTDNCKRQYGVLPRPHWITTYYGGQNIELILKRFGSNIIFSNGLKDPYSSGGVLKNLSDTLVAVTTTNGSHCLDILKSSPNDPVWLITQRQTEIKIIEDWIAKYYADLSITRSRLNQSYQRK